MGRGNNIRSQRRRDAFSWEAGIGKNDQCLKDYFQDIKEEKLIKDDIFNISFNDIVLDDIDTSNEYYEHNDNYLSYFSL